MAISHQSAMTERGVRARPPAVDSPHALVDVEHAAPLWTLAKIAGLVMVAACGTALVVAIVFGSALFAILNLR
jgi:hypothetical protein